MDSGVRCELGKWTHVALVCERESLQLWVNGRPAGEPLRHRPNTPTTSFSIGCDQTTNRQFSLQGEIDEVRLSRLLGPFRAGMLLLPAAGSQSPVTSNRPNTTAVEGGVSTNK